MQPLPPTYAEAKYLRCKIMRLEEALKANREKFSRINSLLRYARYHARQRGIKSVPRTTINPTPGIDPYLYQRVFDDEVLASRPMIWLRVANKLESMLRESNNELKRRISQANRSYNRVSRRLNPRNNNSDWTKNV